MDRIKRCRYIVAKMLRNISPVSFFIYDFPLSIKGYLLFVIDDRQVDIHQ